MRVLIQRVSRASVSVNGFTDDSADPPSPARRVVSEIGPGLVLLVGVGQEDGPEDAATLAEKCAHLRIFEDDTGKMNRSVVEVGGEVLAISQFTLYGDTRKGRRPNFMGAASPERAEPLYEAFVARLRSLGLRVGTGVFGAAMQVEIHNDGPVTIGIDSEPSRAVGHGP